MEYEPDPVAFIARDQLRKRPKDHFVTIRNRGAREPVAAVAWTDVAPNRCLVVKNLADERRQCRITGSAGKRIAGPGEVDRRSGTVAEADIELHQTAAVVPKAAKDVECHTFRRELVRRVACRDAKGLLHWFGIDREIRFINKGR